MRLLVGVVMTASVVAGCSGSDAAQSEGVSPQQTPVASTDGNADADVETDGNGDADVETAAGDEVTPEPTVAPGLDDEDLAGVTNLAAGEQVEDAQGNLIVVYGFAEWPASFAELPEDVLESFPFFGAIDGVADPTSQLIVLDVGMCAAGVDGNGSGTAEFSVHGAATDVSTSDPTLERGVLAGTPLVQPSFVLPSAAECARGWLPMLSSAEEPAAIARYVLATRQSSGTEVERHVYQWELASVTMEVAADAATADLVDAFEPGETVTFNEGVLAGTTVDVEGWAEYVGQASALEGTRMVGVSLSVCAASGEFPQFGLAVDGWNLVAPLDPEPIEAYNVADSSTPCFDGWVDFAVPFGGVPTGFFASDGANATTGYAEWSLVDAALATPE